MQSLEALRQQLQEVAAQVGSARDGITQAHQKGENDLKEITEKQETLTAELQAQSTSFEEWQVAQQSAFATILEESTALNGQIRDGLTALLKEQERLNINWDQHCASLTETTQETITQVIEQLTKRYSEDKEKHSAAIQEMTNQVKIDWEVQKQITTDFRAEIGAEFKLSRDAFEKHRDATIDAQRRNDATIQSLEASLGDLAQASDSFQAATQAAQQELEAALATAQETGYSARRLARYALGGLAAISLGLISV